jgi:hypothetical protein
VWAYAQGLNKNKKGRTLHVQGTGMEDEKELLVERTKLEKRYKNLNYRLWIILGGKIYL